MPEGKPRRRAWQPDPVAGRARRPLAIGALVAPAKQVFLDRSGIALDRETWRRAVGDRIAARAEPGSFQGGTLSIRVASATWAQELSLLSSEIRQRLARLGVTVQRLRFLVHDGAGYKMEQRARRPASKEPLPDPLRKRLERIEDTELAAAIAEAAGFSLGRSQNQKPRRRRS